MEARAYNGLKTVSARNGAGRTGRYVQNMKLDHRLTPHASINLKLIKDLNIILDTIKALEKILGNKISDIPLDNVFLGKGNKGKYKQM